MSDKVTFAQFDAVMAELGFEQQVIAGSHVNYRHARLDGPIMIRLHKPKDIVPGYVLLSARRELELFGVVGTDRFDELLHATAA